MELLPEVEVWWGLPALRRQLALALKEQGHSQKDIAAKLNIAESAVSQYISGKRGSSTFPESFLEEIACSAHAIAKGDATTANTELIRLLDAMREKRVICDIHRQHSDVPHHCSHCFENDA